MKIHLIGIGGIGVSALAQYYLAKGEEVSGSDLVSSEITEMLQKRGVKIIIGNLNKNISKNLDLVVYSPAVKQENIELKMAKELGIKLQSYPEALGELTKEYYTIAIAGAHGKSTTTSMLGILMQEAGLDPTVIVGTKVKEFGNTNFRFGRSKFLVIEACEYDSSFLNYFPKITIITNIDKEHLDFFKTFSNIKKAFLNFIMRLPSDGFLVLNKDDKNIPEVEKGKFKIKKYFLNQKEAKNIKNILKVPGDHNISNALAVLEVSKILGVPEEIFLKSLSKFNGTWRRFDVKESVFNKKRITVISDYGHHPTEIFATLFAAREKYPNKKIWCIFQPHQHQRTFYLFNEFINVFRKTPVDKIIITDIYDVAGREVNEINKDINSQKLVKEINKNIVAYSPLDKLEDYVKENIKNEDVLIIMGAGDIYKFADKF